MGRIPDETAPCGIYCGSCPSFRIRKTCLGCGSDDGNQKRKSKWSCKIRNCCFENKNLDFCIECDEFPCNILEKKLKKSHLGDKKFKYRHEIYDNLCGIKEAEVENWVKQQENRFKCPKCDRNIVFYENKCNKCGYEDFL